MCENVSSVRPVTASDEQAWQVFVQSHNDATLYHDFAWRDFYTSVFTKQTCYLASFDPTGAIDGVLPLVRQKSLLFGDYLVSLPFFNYGGTLAANEKVRQALLNAAAALSQELDVSHSEIRETAPLADWQSRTDKVAMVLELPDDEEALGKALGAKRRSQIKRPLREDPQTVKGGPEQLDDFYAVFARNMRDLGTPVYGKYMFAEILRRFPDNAEIINIQVRGKPAATAFLLHHGGTTEIPWASTVRDFNSISINMLLYWEALRSAIGRGSGQFDFGRSTVDSGTYRFKKQWGAEPRQLYWHYWLREGEDMPGLNPDSGKYALAIRVWQKLPLWLTNLAGPGIVKNLP